MGRNGWIVVLILVLVLVGVSGLFVVQNSARTTQLSLDLGFAAWRLEKPVAVPALVGICLGAGFLGGSLVFGMRGMRLANKVRRLEQELAVGAAVAPPSPGSTTPRANEPGAW